MGLDKFVFNRVLIIGVGLIGGSIGLACKKNRKHFREIVGFTKSKDRAKELVKNRIVDFATTDLAEACKGADLVILASPFNLFDDYILQLKHLLDPNAVVTDVASVKGGKALIWMIRYGKNFVPGHPMAGSEKLGFKNAKANLFEGKPCILTPQRMQGFKWTTDVKAITKVKAFWYILGAKVFELGAIEHDEVIGSVSHLTHAMVFAYLRVVSKTAKVSLGRYAGPGFWDTTRIGASNSSLWTEILRGNSKEVSKSLRLLSKELRDLARLILDSDKKNLRNYIEVASTYRRNLKP